MNLPIIPAYGHGESCACAQLSSKFNLAQNQNREFLTNLFFALIFQKQDINEPQMWERLKQRVNESYDKAVSNQERYENHIFCLIENEEGPHEIGWEKLEHGEKFLINALRRDYLKTNALKPLDSDRKNELIKLIDQDKLNYCTQEEVLNNLCQKIMASNESNTSIYALAYASYDLVRQESWKVFFKTVCDAICEGINPFPSLNLNMRLKFQHELMKTLIEQREINKIYLST